MNKQRAVVLLSGGMDSSTLAYWLTSAGYTVLPLAIHYGQRHAKELDAARAISKRLDVDLKLVDLQVLRDVVSASALTGDTPVPHGHYAEDSMRQTVVPNRNAILLAIAFGYAVTMNADAVGYAAHEGDHVVYPDCRPEFVDAFARMQSLAVYPPAPKLLAPFLQWTKSGIAGLGVRELHVPYELTWSCYEGGEVHCGKCGTCVERREAFTLADVTDPTTYRVGI